LCTNTDNCYGCAKSKIRIDHPKFEGHFGGHPHETGEIEDCNCLSIVDVDYRFFDPDRDIELVKLYADMIARDEAIYAELRSNRPRCPFEQDDGGDEDDHNDEVTAEEDMDNYCREYIRWVKRGRMKLKQCTREGSRAGVLLNVSPSFLHRYSRCVSIDQLHFCLNFSIVIFALSCLYSLVMV
jgi:hypothetical protein